MVYKSATVGIFRSTMSTRVALRALCFLTFVIYFSGLAYFANTQSAVASPVGVNLQGVAYYTPQQPFLNIFKTGDRWTTRTQTNPDTGEGALLESSFLDANGYPTTLTGGPAHTFNQLSILLLRELPAPWYYRGGRYILLYDGEGAFEYHFDATRNVSLSTPGRDVLDVTPSAAGIFIFLTATDPNKTGNYVRNIRLVYEPNEGLLAGGEMFNPDLISRISLFKTLRFMDWMATNHSPQSAWNSRPLPNQVFWGSPAGVPLEVMVALSNKMGADPWFNMPHMATDDYVTQFATKVRQLLAPTRQVYVEYSNETWNSVFAQTHWIAQQGNILGWPDFGRSFYGMRTAQISEIWKRVWGSDAGRVKPVIGSQTGWTDIAVQALNCQFWDQKPCSKNHGIEYLAITGYFGDTVPSSWTSQPDGGLNYLFTELLQGGLDPNGYPGGNIKKYIDQAAANKAVADSYGLGLIGYEGGSGLTDMTGNQALENLYVAANRDPRMSTVYTTFLTKWNQVTGGAILNQFTDVSQYNKFGAWGLLENVLQSQSPKYDAFKKLCDD